ncbi:MAG: DUF262 domain-containing protein [Treponema sp.]|jgi:hypothetical protein|nr:DUF262 domain-containing protein [Treponema sp.]
MIEDKGDDTENQEEGFDISPDLEMHDYPLDSLLIREDPRSVFEVCRRIDDGTYILDPDFQRDFIWPLEKQSRLIESLLMRIPLPVFYLAERSDGKVIVIDGLQRLTTLSRFLNNTFALRNLDTENKNFSGKKFSDLSVKLKNRLEDTKLIIYILDEKVPERARLDIFERVNGGTPLSRQQMRNCMYCGPATKLLKKLAGEKVFLDATGEGLNKKNMRDREVINRFFAYKLIGTDNYNGDMDGFLASVLVKMNGMETDQLSILEAEFKRSMCICHSIWGGHTFRRYQPEQNRRSVVNAALFDVLSHFFGNYKGELTEIQKEEIRKNLFNLFDDEEFINAITWSTNSLKQVKIRFIKIENAFKGVLL